MIDGTPFILDGPILPNKVRESHEKGNLVLFCGAGISYKLGLKDFKGLTEDLYENLNSPELLKEGEEKQEFDRGNYDRVLGFLENSSGEEFRNELKKWGEIKSAKADLSTHKSIIDLSTTDKAGIRLVTTNFDLGFSKLIEREEEYKKITIDSAPKLPVAKVSKWNNSIVHLHGIGTDPENVVVTSADFGSAYITERWCSRFVTDLFYNFDILFIGYSLNDPVLRYLIDAIASESKKESIETRIFAFIEKGNEASWNKKGIIPIEFDPKDEFYYLHETLKEWAKRYKEGSLGFKKLYSSLYNKPPVDEDNDDAYIINELFNNAEEQTHLFVINTEKENGKEVTKYPRLGWWLQLSKEEDERKQKNKETESLVNMLVSRNDETPLPIKGFHRYYIYWFTEFLMQFDEIKKWVVDRGGCLHPSLVEEILLKYDEIFKDLSKSDKQFWDYLVFNREALLLSDFFKPRHYFSLRNLKSSLNSQKISALLKVYAELRYTNLFREEKNDDEKK